MLFARRFLLRGVVALVLLTSTVSGIASLLAAPAWPNRPVTMVSRTRRVAQLISWRVSSLRDLAQL